MSWEGPVHTKEKQPRSQEFPMAISQPFTCGQIDDVEEHLFALYHIYDHMRKPAVVLHEIRNGYDWLNDLMHQNKFLSILEIPFSQIQIKTLVRGAALEIDEITTVNKRDIQDIQLTPKHPSPRLDLT